MTRDIQILIVKSEGKIILTKIKNISTIIQIAKDYNNNKDQKNFKCKKN